MTDPTVLQFAEGVGSNDLAFTNPTTPNSAIIVFVTNDSASPGSNPSGITSYLPSHPTSSDVFVMDESDSCANSVANVNVSLWRCARCVGGTTHLSIGLTPESGVIYLAAEIGDVVGGLIPVGIQPNAAPANTAQSSFDTGSAGTAPAGSFLIAGIDGVGSGGRGVATPSGSWTNETPEQPGGAHSVLLSHQVLGSDGAIQYAGSLAVSTYWAAIVGAYKQGGAASGLFAASTLI